MTATLCGTVYVIWQKRIMQSASLKRRTVFNTQYRNSRNMILSIALKMQLQVIFTAGVKLMINSFSFMLALERYRALIRFAAFMP